MFNVFIGIITGTYLFHEIIFNDITRYCYEFYKMRTQRILNLQIETTRFLVKFLEVCFNQKLGINIFNNNFSLHQSE